MPGGSNRPVGTNSNQDLNAQAPQQGNMMPGWQTCTGPDRRMNLNTRSPIRIGTWNVRTMNQLGKDQMLSREMDRIKVHLLGISEVRWLGSGEKILSDGKKIIYSGHENLTRHTQGVALMLSKNVKSSLISWRPHGSRIIEALFKTSNNNIKLRIIMCYAPTNDAESESKDEYFLKLDSVISSKFSNKDILILMGDMNAKVGEDNTGYTNIMGKHGLGVMNDNGERFANLCLENSLVIGGTLFPHKPIHKYTWMSPGDRARNQIDHICISQKFRRSLQDVRTKRGADGDSDHNLVIANLQLKLKAMPKTKDFRCKYYVNKLKNPDIQLNFQLELSNRFQALEIPDDSNVVSEVERDWVRVKEAINDTCKEVLGYKKRTDNPWISDHSLSLIKLRIDAQDKLCSQESPDNRHEYNVLNKRVKRSVCRDKRNYIEDLATAAEEAAARFDSKTLYDITKKLSKQKTSSTTHIKDSQGNLLTTTEEQQARWVEHFSAVLNRPPPVVEADVPTNTPILDINTAPPDKDEIKKAINSLKTGKAAGPDDIPPEALKATNDISSAMMENLLKKVWTTETVPEDWKDGHLTVLPKKGDLTICDNSRGIMLLSVPGKVMCKVILERLKKAVDKKLRKNQAGFRSGRSCADQIVSLRIIIEQALEQRYPCYINFVDYRKAFDSLDRKTLWKILAHYGIPKKLISLIKSIYENPKTKVLYKGKLSAAFLIETGVRQGCLLSPFLFILAIDYILKNCSQGNGLSWINKEELDDLDFADDLAELADSHQQMQAKTNDLKQISESVGLQINIEKTKTMKINIDNDDQIMIDGQALENVDNFTYLGSVITTTGGSEEDINNRLKKARSSFGMLGKVWKCRGISRDTKVRLFNSNVKSILLYGSESWSLTKKNESKLQVFINNCLRKILQIYWPQTISNEELWRTTKQVPVSKQIMKRKYKWLGHTLRKHDSEIPKQALVWNPPGTRRRGRPRLTWRRQTTKEMVELGMTLDQAEQLAQDRNEWRRFANGLCPTDGWRL